MKISLRYFIGTLALGAVLLGGVALSATGTEASPAGRAAVPADAPEVAPGVFSLGTKFEAGLHVEGYAVVRRALPAKPDGTPGGGGGKGRGDSDDGDSSASCFSYLANGAAWSGTHDYVVDFGAGPSIGDVDESALVSGMEFGVAQWNAVTALDVFGADAGGDADIASIGVSTNGVHEVAFASIADSGVIAVTYVWGVFRGPPSSRGLVEWDMLLDGDADWDWRSDASGSTDAGYQVDLWAILTHELGHAAGLGHPADDCTLETMFRFYGDAQTHQRSIEAGDIAGAQSLYGADAA